MSDSLLSHYESELAFLQQAAADFARKHPAAASRLQLNEDTVEDPLVERLLSGVAFLNARIQQKLSDDFPELTDAMLDTLYPHYLRPIPSFCIVNFEPNESLDKAAFIKRGRIFESEKFNGNSCKFTNCYDTDLYPIKLSSAELMARPFIAPGSNSVSNASAVLRLRFNPLSEKLNISDLGIKSLRMYLKGLPQFSYPLYDLILQKAVKVVLASGDDDPKPQFLDPKLIQQVGFDENQGLLEYPNNVSSAYRLLTEFFCFPEKFGFIDLHQIGKHIDARYSNQLDVYIYLSESNSELEYQVDAQSFSLHCAPAVNLFKHEADPIALTETKYEYQVVPDARYKNGFEVYSIDDVVGLTSENKKTHYLPFYGVRHSRSQGDAFWFSKRENLLEGEHLNEVASEVQLSLVDLDYQNIKNSEQTLKISLTCTNRNLPRKLPTGNNQPYLMDSEGGLPVSRISCTVPPTSTLRSPQKERSYWRIISHLNLNHLSLGGANQPASHTLFGKASGPGLDEPPLREIMRLYDFKDSASTRKMIESLLDVKTKGITAPIQVQGMIVMSRGTEVELVFDPILLSGTSALMFASVLERFCGLYCSINSFTRVVVRMSGHDDIYKQWPPRAGDRVLL
ncbi:type VI secretion system baseplate subunit TssF [Sessilibacter sp. MAH1]